MNILGFNFSKISIEKKELEGGELKINSNLDVTDINEANFPLFESKEALLTIKFHYSIEYDPSIAKLEFKGDMLVGIEQEKAREVLEKWKDKKISEEIRIVIFNTILKKANIRALQLEDDMGLPLHIPLPRITTETNKKQD